MRPSDFWPQYSQSMVHRVTTTWKTNLQFLHPPLSRVISSGTQSYTLKDALKVSPQKINTDICFVVFCWLQNIWFGLFQAAQHRLIQLHHSTTAASLFTALD